MALIIMVRVNCLHMYVLMYSAVCICTLYQLAGRLYDKNGIRRQWWTNASIEEFIERTQCFVQQYSKYKMFGYNVRFHSIERLSEKA